MRVCNDLLEALDGGSSCVLVLLDLSAVFDTIDHAILLQRLQHTFGITGTALAWFRSFRSQRQQTVVIDGESSDPQLLEYGVPQGSVLGPKLYSMYTMPLGHLLKQAHLEHQFYADDTQGYNTFFPSTTLEKSEGLKAVEKGAELARSWFEQNMLKLNTDKTEVLAITPRTRPAVDITITIGDSVIKSKPCVQDLGVNLDNTLSMESQVSQVCRSASYHLRSIGSSRRYLTTEAAKSLVNGLVTSRLDYCNALLVGLPKTLINKLQRVQNTAARVVTRTPRSQHITPVLSDLHWLPVSSRIEYKILLYVYKALSGSAPEYLTELIQQKVPSRTLRSKDSVRLLEPRTRTKTYGQRSFRSAAASLWNALPQHMRSLTTVSSFKRTLKTYLFKLHYD
jgi:hypothetical protein